MSAYKIFRKSFGISRRNKFLWSFGFFTACLHLGNRFYHVYDSFPDKIGIDVFSDPGMQFGFAYFAALFTVIVLFLGSLAQAGHIISVQKIHEQQKPAFKTCLKNGGEFWTKVLGFALMKMIIIFSLLFTIYALPENLPVENKIVRFLSFAVSYFSSIVFKCLIVCTWFASTFGMRYLVLEHLSIAASFRSGMKLFFGNITASLKAGLFYVLLLSIITAISATAAALYFLISFSVALINFSAGIFFFSLTFLLLIIPFSLIAWGLAGTLRDTFWTLTFIAVRNSAAKQ